jgi:hypothetical protein
LNSENEKINNNKQNNNYNFNLGKNETINIIKNNNHNFNSRNEEINNIRNNINEQFNLIYKENNNKINNNINFVKEENNNIINDNLMKINQKNEDDALAGNYILAVININENNINNELNDSENINKDNYKKQNLFSTFPKDETEINVEDIKKKKLLMNRQSAKKSRLKKKNYIENLEKQYNLMKEEYIRIIESNKLKNADNLITKNNNNINIDNNIRNNEINVNKILLESKKGKAFKLNKSDKNKITNDLLKSEESGINNIKTINEQKKLLSYLLINQIDIMTPINIKAFQSKFLKLQILDADDSIDIIKNKINMNLNTIIELYGIEGENNIPNINICNKKKSMAYKLFTFYRDINLLVNHFEKIYSLCNDIGNI